MDIFTKANLKEFKQVQDVHDVLAPNEVTHKTMALKTSSSLYTKNWIRPLGYVERFMVDAQKCGNMTTLYAIWIDSNKPLNLAHIMQAGSILYRKMPNLQMTIGRKNNELWWRKSEKENLNVDEIHTDDFTDTFESMRKTKFKIENDPLWFIRLIKLKEKGAFANSTSTKQLKQICVFGFHHSMTDGTTNMRICKVFLDILNNLFINKPSDTKPEGTFAPPLQDKLANEYMSSSSLTSLFLKRFFRGFLCCGANVGEFTKLYPQPSHIEASTKVIYNELDELTTSQLLQRCKNEEVSLNSAFTAAANLGMYDLIEAKYSFKGEAKIKSTHVVNMRRFWPKESQSSSFGCHISSMDIRCNTHYKNHNNFWEYTREVHSVLNKNLNETKYSLKVLPLCERLNLWLTMNSWLSRLGISATNENHFSISNMGNLSKTFQGTGSEVRVSKFMRSVSGHFTPSLCNHNIQTFQGKLVHSLDYYTQKMKGETAASYAKNVLSILKEAV